MCTSKKKNETLKVKKQKRGTELKHDILRCKKTNIRRSAVKKNIFSDVKNMYDTRL